MRNKKRRLTLTGHLEELRYRLAICLAAFLFGFAISLTQATRMIVWLRRPAEPYVTHFVFFSPTEGLMAYVKVAVLSALSLSLPVVLWQVWAFLRLGLTKREKSYGGVFVGWGTVLFALGVAFAYGILLPASLKVLLGIGNRLLQPVLSIDQYLSFVITLTVWCGAIFELPVLLWFLAKIGIVTPEWLRQQRPMAILGMAIASGLLTPTTDPVNLILMMVPMVVLYEISIALTAWGFQQAQNRSRMPKNSSSLKA